MDFGSTTPTVDHYYLARRRRILILLAQRRSRQGIATQRATIPVHPSFSINPNLPSVDDVIFSVSAHNTSNGTPVSSNYQCLENDVGPSMARKKRRIILSNKRNTPNNANKENISITGQSILFKTQTPMSGQCLPLTANLSNVLNTAPLQRHVRQPISHKNPAHYSDDANSHSEDDLNCCSSSDDDAELDNEPLVDSHLEEYSDIRDRVWECPSCHASMWYQEHIGNTRHTTAPKFTRCCRSGKVVLPLLNDPPQLLQHLLHNGTSLDSKNYQSNIRTYNAMFSFTSPGMKFDNTVADGGGPPTLRLHGQTCHRIGTLIPKDGRPQYAQLYIFDTDSEIDNRLKCFSKNKVIKRDIVSNLKLMLDECNPQAKAFRMARDLLKVNAFLDLKLRLISDRPEDGRVYNTPTVSEVAALIVGDIDPNTPRDIIIHARDGHLQQIDEFHPAYLAYQYPLIFVYGEDGYRKNILHRYEHEQQLHDQSRGTQANTAPKRGKRVVLPSNFVGSKRYMDQLYFDEITCALSGTSLKPHDRPYLVTKVFKNKFDELMTDITKRHVLGKVIAFMYTIEFQKRGLPHAHILVFLHPQSKYPTPSDIDKIICAEIPDPAVHPALYDLVSAYMMNGPCGPLRMKSQRRSDSHVIHKNGVALDNRHVVPYNTRFLLKYHAHINMEWPNQVTSIKYIFKYIHKGFDRITATISASNSASGSDKEPVDEIK
ncbi:uncharacterized protein LOC131613788 [Vicia villosa]|uniref:uncharacterized protein LOC131613788 n=1 Tax=Vicia villosa TaxID=3911 RepID=UPI00273B42EE|nr:uncharacterized protein LOC131613788 [Vicia villosa]